MDVHSIATQRLGAVSALSLFGLLAVPWLADGTELHGMQQTPPFVEVSGSAEISIETDRATISFAVETEAPTAAEAASMNADRMDAVVRRLRGSGMSGMEIETFGYNLFPVYTRPDRNSDRPPEIERYRVLNNIRVRVDDLTAIGSLIDSAIAAGANRVSSLAFEATDTKAAELEAVRMAVASAREQAQAMAVALGARLGDPVEVRGGAQVPGGPIVMLRTTMAMEAAETPIEPGSKRVQANVTVRFALHPGA